MITHSSLESGFNRTEQEVQLSCLDKYRVRVCVVPLPRFSDMKIKNQPPKYRRDYFDGSLAAREDTGDMRTSRDVDIPPKNSGGVEEEFLSGWALLLASVPTPALFCVHACTFGARFASMEDPASNLRRKGGAQLLQQWVIRLEK